MLLKTKKKILCKQYRNLKTISKRNGTFGVACHIQEVTRKWVGKWKVISSIAATVTNT